MTSDREATPVPPPSKDRRWDIDERGRGIADARRLVPRIEGLARAADTTDWIAEQPEMHLWPHLQRAIEAAGSPWISGSFSVDADGTLVVELVHRPVDDDGARAALQVDTMALIGMVIEGSSYVGFEQRRADGTLGVDVVTGMLEDETPFRGHGHTMRVRARLG
jgi:hypothetical protein